MNLINTYHPDIICGTESWLNSEISSSEVFSSGYNVYCSIVLFYGMSPVSHFLCCRHIQQHLVCQINLSNNLKLIVCSVYCFPSSNIHYLDDLCKQLESIKRNYPDSTLWIAGDCITSQISTGRITL